MSNSSIYALDNAAKIFPPTSGKRDTKVFRFSCELVEDVDPDFLQKALDRTIEEFPIYRSSLRQGLFWYYLRETPVRPVAREESAPPCSAIYNVNKYNLLFEVTYFQSRINLEVYHALTDGTGALQFLKTLVYYYITLKYQDEFSSIPANDYDASFSQKAEDSFQKYYVRGKKRKQEHIRAYKIHNFELPDGRIKIIEGMLSVKKLLEKAHEHHTTMSVFLASIFLCAINNQAPLRKKKRPIVLTVPVNLRNYFHSESARNFFCTIDVRYNFSSQPSDLACVIEEIDRQFKQLLTPENLAARMNSFSAIEHNAFARVVPLFLKNFVLGIAGRLGARESTGSISNIGRITMPEGFERYIRMFDVFISTEKVQACVCSYLDTLTISFTSAFHSTDIQKDFFRMLSGMGLDITIATNQIYEEDGSTI
jgi:NRPS condensation-like uncharacterized protein